MRHLRASLLGYGNASGETMIFEVDGASQSTFLCLKYSLMKLHSVSLLFMGDTLGFFLLFWSETYTTSDCCFRNL